MTQATAAKLIVLDPTVQADTVEVLLAPRLETLDGKRLALLDNHKQNAAEFLEELFALLAQRYELLPPVRVKKDNGSAPAPPKLLDELAAQCDAVITAIGD